ncbi:uncharacterized protein LOC123301388 [Chrysoperla carnea]|uniref:uncharacterized protein LOC123301388 n=1 Tax=Chrysoperla carnea TaxID=189513 RepID=UPI001D076189|nr:uncharacterized protein LOC123301388 [Chrysoperla carnea]
MLDRYTRWPEAIPIEDITAEVVSRAFYSGWICRFGVPHKLTTDQGCQFESSLFTQLVKYLGMEKLRTAPQSNGCVERWHRVLKAALKCHLECEKWTKLLPTVLLGIRATIRKDTMGQKLRLPGEFFTETKTKTDFNEVMAYVMNAINNLRPAPFNTSKNNTFAQKTMQHCTHVFLRDDKVR